MPENCVYFGLQDAPGRDAQSTIGRRLLLQMTSTLTGELLEAFRIATEASGRPILEREDGRKASVWISLSHSGPHLAVAATNVGPIGIDIERPRLGRNLDGIAEAAFGEEERRRYAEEGPPGFYRIWTLREAMAKAVGAGITMVGDRVDRAALGPDTGDWRWRDWHLAHYRPGPNLSLALAVQVVEPDLADIAWRRVTLPGA